MSFIRSDSVVEGSSNVLNAGFIPMLPVFPGVSGDSCLCLLFFCTLLPLLPL